MITIIETFHQENNRLYIMFLKAIWEKYLLRRRLKEFLHNKKLLRCFDSAYLRKIKIIGQRSEVSIQLVTRIVYWALNSMEPVWPKKNKTYKWKHRHTSTVTTWRVIPNQGIVNKIIWLTALGNFTRSMLIFVMFSALSYVKTYMSLSVLRNCLKV